MFWPLPWGRVLSRVEFLGEMSDVLHSCAPLALIPPTPFSHKGSRGSLGALMAETRDGTQGLAKKSTPVSDGTRQPAQAGFAPGSWNRTRIGTDATDQRG